MASNNSNTTGSLNDSNEPQTRKLETEWASALSDVPEVTAEGTMYKTVNSILKAICKNMAELLTSDRKQAPLPEIFV